MGILRLVDGKILRVDGRAAVSDACCCTPPPPPQCCCVPATEEVGAHWEFGKTQEECAELGGTWATCPPGGCDCPACTITASVLGHDMFDPDCVPGVNWSKVLFYGDRNPAANPFGYPFIPGYGLINKIAVIATANRWYDCNAPATASLGIYKTALTLRDEGLVAGECPPNDPPLFGGGMGTMAWGRYYGYFWQGNPDPGPCFGESTPPLVEFPIGQPPGVYEEYGDFARLQLESQGAWDAFDAEPAISISCGPNDYACETP